MKKWFTFLSVIYAFNLTVACFANQVQTVSLEKVHEAVTQNQPNITIVDVRKASEFAQGHIPGSINLPYDKYDKFQGKNMEFPGLNKNGVNYVYCYNEKCSLAARACKAFSALGYSSKEIAGGYASWQAKNYPIQLAQNK